VTQNVDIVVRRLDRQTNYSVFLEIGSIHASEISAGLLAQLGPHFLAKLYRYLATDNYVFGAFKNERVVGFISGTADAATVNKRFLLNVGVSGLFRLFIGVMKLSKLKRALSLWSHLSQEKSVDLPVAELLSIAVLPDFTRLGIGIRLVRSLEESFANSKITRYKIIASETQVIAHEFYNKLGGESVGVTTLGGLKTDIFVVNIRRT
jgi:ribosomal protein S18 acetylase RimI-like enzyme